MRALRLLQDAVRALRRPAQWLAGLGLMLALAAGLLVAQLAWRLADIDPAVPEPERLILLDFMGNPPGQRSAWFTASPVVFADWLKQRRVPLEQISRSSEDSFRLRLRGEMSAARLLLVDPDWAPLLGVNALHGNLAATLNSRDQLALTPALVRDLWGDLPLRDALGRSIESRGLQYRVGAIVPEPDARSPQPGYRVLAGYDSQANAMSADDRQAVYMVNGRVYARLAPGVRAEQVGAWMRDAFRASSGYAALPPEWREGREAAYFRALPVLRLPFEGEAARWRWQQLGALGAAAALLLLLATVNAANLQAARLLSRQRETALRRALGADAAALLRLWAAETGLLLLAVGLGALLLSWWLLPALGAWMGLALPEFPQPPLLAGLAATLLLLGPLLLAGPALLALRRPPAAALQGRSASEGPAGRRLRQSLLALQLAGALGLLGLTGVLLAQVRHVLLLDRGFATENRLVMSVLAGPEDVHIVPPLLEALARQPAIRHWAFSASAPARDRQWTTELHVNDRSGDRVQLRVNPVSPGYFATYGLRVLAGNPTQLRRGEEALVLDARAAAQLGFASPQAAVGQLLRGGGEFLQEGQRPRRVTAVVAAVKFEPARQAGMPQSFLVDEQPQGNLTVYGPDLQALRAALDAAWLSVGAPLVRWQSTADEQLAEAYRQETQTAGLLAAVAVLAAGVAALGAYTLVADTLQRRRREIVLHRLHGAGHGAVLRLVLREFTPPLAVAWLLAWPLGIALGERYLAGFVDRLPLPAGVLLPLAGASLLLMLVLLLATARQLRLALRLQPLEALG